MAYKQWIGIENRSRLRRSDIRIKDAKLESGKFYRGNKDNEIGPSEISKIVIAPQSEASVHSCGRSDAAIGTEGQYTLYEWNGTHETKICRCIGARHGVHTLTFSASCTGTRLELDRGWLMVE
ncbi:Asp-hemolysin [Metarhizium anisopliae]|nr:Asp-hemolysin [Metarhizium anisopliae]